MGDNRGEAYLQNPLSKSKTENIHGFMYLPWQDN